MVKKKIGILTGGGDCPGINAVIRAVTKKAIYEKEMSRRDMIGYSIVGYFLLLSTLLYLKIVLQRSKLKE